MLRGYLGALAGPRYCPWCETVQSPRWWEALCQVQGSIQSRWLDRRTQNHHRRYHPQED